MTFPSSFSVLIFNVVLSSPKITSLWDSNGTMYSKNSSIEDMLSIAPLFVMALWLLSGLIVGLYSALHNGLLILDSFSNVLVTLTETTGEGGIAVHEEELILINGFILLSTILVTFSTRTASNLWQIFQPKHFGFF